MADLDMEAAAGPLGLSVAPLDIITMVLQYVCLEDRFTCALVCKAWAKAAAAATRIILKRKPTVQKLIYLQQWLEKHGNQIKVLRLDDCSGAALTALPCAQLQDLVLIGGFMPGSNLDIGSRVWGDIAAAIKLTSVSMEHLQTAAQQADVVSALTALPDLKQLTWCRIQCSDEPQLSDSLLLQHLTKLTALTIHAVSATALEHLGLLTKLENLDISAAGGWAAAGCPGLQELKALTKLHLWLAMEDIPPCVCQLTALQELQVFKATPAALISLQALTGLTQLYVRGLVDLPLDTPPLQLPGLQHLVLCGLAFVPVSFLASCTQLRVLDLWGVNLSCSGPGSLVASTMLQDLTLRSCRLSAANGAAGGPVSWQQVLPGPGRLPHLTSLLLSRVRPNFQQVDVESCCSSLQVLDLESLKDGFASALVQLSGLTRLTLEEAGDEQCGALAQLTGLRELTVRRPDGVSAAGLRQLAALEQLTSLGFGDSFDPSKVSRMLQQQMSDTLGGYPRAIANKVCVYGGLGE